MTVEAVKGYASDVLVGAACGDQEMVSLVGYLNAMVDEPVLDSKLVCAVYFVSAYTLGRCDRDNNAAETSAMQRWSDRDAKALADHVRDHAQRDAAFDQYRRASRRPA